MKDQFENLLAPDGLISRFLYLVLFAVIFYLCEFILIALAVFQFLHLAITGEKNEKVTGFATDFSAYLGNVSAYLTLASEDKPFPFRDWNREAGAEVGPAVEPKPVAEAEKPAKTSAKTRKKTASKKTARKKTARKAVKKPTTKE